MPDALSKTVPIWCCVLNRTLFPDRSDYQDLSTPQLSVSESEHAQILERIQKFVEELQTLDNSSLSSLRDKISKPLRPLWVTRESTLPDIVPQFEDCHPIVLCTASRRVKGGEISEGGYIQGAGDDSEGWASGLTAPVFWKNKDLLMETAESNLPGLIETLSESHRIFENTATSPVLISPTTWLHVSTTDYIKQVPDLHFKYDGILYCSENHIESITAGVETFQRLHLKCSNIGKLGSRDLRHELPRLIEPIVRIGRHRRTNSLIPYKPPKLLVCCQTGKDLSVGVALAILCLFSTQDGGFVGGDGVLAPKAIDKAFIRQKMNWLTLSMAGVNPSRATLQSVNAFLMNDSTLPSLQACFLSADDSTDTKGKLSREYTGLRREEQIREPAPVFTNTLRLFLSLEGTWSIFRRITSFLPTHPSGTLQGSATFCFMSSPPTSRLTSPTLVQELLYSETGTFTTSNGLQMTARRQYLYRYSSREDSISVHFVEESSRVLSPISNSGTNVQVQEAGLFLDIEIDWIKLSTNSGTIIEGRVKGKSREKHLCGNDLYNARYDFDIGVSADATPFTLKSWTLEYTAKGPKKDYVSATTYQREV